MVINFGKKNNPVVVNFMKQINLCGGNKTNLVNPLPHMPILGPSNSAANKDMSDVKNIDKWGYNFQIE